MNIQGDGGIFGNSTRTTVLMVIGMLEETHAGEIATILGRSRSRVKEAVDALERLGVLSGTTEGTNRRLRLNPRYVAAPELKQLIMKLGAHDVELQAKLAEVRRRPRRAGKPL